MDGLFTARHRRRLYKVRPGDFVCRGRGALAACTGTVLKESMTRAPRPRKAFLTTFRPSANEENLS